MPFCCVQIRLTTGSYFSSYLNRFLLSARILVAFQVLPNITELLPHLSLKVLPVVWWIRVLLSALSFYSNH